MWVCLSDSFLSIVSKDCASDELLVRARRKGDIEKIFPEATVKRDTKTDYLYRARVKRLDVENAMVGEVRRIDTLSSPSPTVPTASATTKPTAP